MDRAFRRGDANSAGVPSGAPSAPKDDMDRAVVQDRPSAAVFRMRLGMQLRDKVAVITGRAEGIGRATGLLFGKEGARVAIGDVVDASGVAESIERAGGDAFYQRTDVT